MNKEDRNMGEGRLPAMAPLANPYVPFQLDNPAKYEPRTALVRGTLFTGLDLPFMGMVNKQEQPVTPTTQLQVISFAFLELALYLDTHQNDKEAFELYTQMQCLYEEAKKEFENQNGPMNHFSVNNNKTYKWLNDPWPWEYAKNKEV